MCVNKDGGKDCFKVVEYQWRKYSQLGEKNLIERV